MAYAIRRPCPPLWRWRPVRHGFLSVGGIFDIVCPPGGRLKMRIGFSAGFCPPGKIQPNPAFESIKCPSNPFRPLKVNQSESNQIKVNQSKKNSKREVGPAGNSVTSRFGGHVTCPGAGPRNPNAVKARQPLAPSPSPSNRTFPGTAPTRVKERLSPLFRPLRE